MKGLGFESPGGLWASSRSSAPSCSAPDACWPLTATTTDSRSPAGRAEVIDFNSEHPVEPIKRLTGGIGVDRVIDAVGLDAERPKWGTAAEESGDQAEQFSKEIAQNAPSDGTWKPGDAPSQALRWAVEGLAKAGTLSIIGVYPPTRSPFRSVWR